MSRAAVEKVEIWRLYRELVGRAMEIGRTGVLPAGGKFFEKSLDANCRPFGGIMSEIFPEYRMVPGHILRPPIVMNGIVDRLIQ